MSISLSRQAALTLTQQLAERLAERIRTRLLPAGARLPSVRECARQQGVSPYTVVAAYDLLQAQGLVEARPQRGFYVRDIVQNPLQTQEGKAQIAINEGAVNTPVGIPPGTRINATMLIRGMFVESVAGKPQPGAGVLPAEWLDAGFLVAAMRKVTSGQALRESLVRYGEPMGDSRLREALARRLQRIGIAAGPGQIITTLGATQALDIVSRALLQPGDPVMVEEPGWAVEYARLAAMGMRVLPVPRGPEGPDMAVMQRYCETMAPKLYVSVSVLHNPTGYSLSAASAHEVLQMAQRHGFYVVEDDSYCHIAADHAPRVSVLDRCSAASTSAALPRCWCPTGAWAIWRRRPSWSRDCWTPSCCPPCPRRPPWSRPWPCAWSKASCAAMPSGCASIWPRRARAAWRWPRRLAAVLWPSLRACSAGWIPVWIPRC
jgi:DNA-binding transcriptional MocR family regulator